MLVGPSRYRRPRRQPCIAGQKICARSAQSLTSGLVQSGERAGRDASTRQFPGRHELPAIVRAKPTRVSRCSQGGSRGSLFGGATQKGEGLWGTSRRCWRTRPGTTSVSDYLQPRSAPWEDGARTDDSVGSYEWWYFDAHLDDGAKLVLSFMNKDDIAGPRKPLAPLLRLNFDLPDGRHFEELRH